MHTLIVIPLDDFNVLLVIDFMKMFKVTPIPYLDGLMFMGEKDKGFLKGINPFDGQDKKNKETVALLSAISIEKGLKKGEPAYLAALVEVKPDVQIEVHDNVAILLNEYKDVMPPELAKELALERKINHMIDLIPESVPLA